MDHATYKSRTSVFYTATNKKTQASAWVLTSKKLFNKFYVDKTSNNCQKNRLNQSNFYHSFSEFKCALFYFGLFVLAVLGFFLPGNPFSLIAIAVQTPSSISKKKST